MTVIYNSVDIIPNISYGKYDCDLDVSALAVESDMINSDNAKKTGSLNLNRFIKVTDTSKSYISSYLNKHVLTCDWTIEYFKSYEPAGLHTDYVSFPNTWISETDVDCHIMVGVIIPLKWKSKQPYTVTYNRVETSPRKLVYKQGNMRYIDTNEIVEYRHKWEYDSEVLKHNPINTMYYKEYADLHVDFAYMWQLGTMLVFDTRRWHSSSWFLSTDTIPQVPLEYKESLVAFGSVNVRR